MVSLDVVAVAMNLVKLCGVVVVVDGEKREQFESRLGRRTDGSRVFGMDNRTIWLP